MINRAAAVRYGEVRARLITSFRAPGSGGRCGTDLPPVASKKHLSRRYARSSWIDASACYGAICRPRVCGRGIFSARPRCCSCKVTKLLRSIGTAKRVYLYFPHVSINSATQRPFRFSSSFAARTSDSRVSRRTSHAAYSRPRSAAPPSPVRFISSRAVTYSGSANHSVVGLRSRQRCPRRK